MANHGIAGKNAREMARHRYKKVAVYAAILFLIAIIIFSNLNSFAKIGLPAAIFFAVIIKLVADQIEKKGLHTKKRAKDADRGAYAEEVVAEILKDLPVGYHAFHDLAFDGFNIDHVVVGPGGIFLVETKSHSGKVDARGENLLLNGNVPEKDFLKQTWSQTYQLRDFLKNKTFREWSVKPVLCFTRAFVKVRQPVKGITVVNKGYLKKYILQQQHDLTFDEIEVISKILSSWISKAG